ncbi:hypothetical protein COCNU_14G012470 [Cocos nucifera]|uniref:Neprosin PEP catalytic domain-containing protein n=1 Tax=Cocos nucifera TaxID=13894 RepID=A0A8K0IXP9_COCNU|nr:hypothetical protein COCNU_14G012470 [Cocos nucifera]
MKMYVSMSYGLVALLLMIISFETMAQATMQQLRVQQHLKRSNKPAIKSIKSPDGDIIDCVHIYHQPAFDHPLLKNHTVQIRPSFPPAGLYDENEVASKMESSSIPQLWHHNGRCPEDTIPIKRTKKEDVLRASSVERYGKKSRGTIPYPTSSYAQVNPLGHEDPKTGNWWLQFGNLSPVGYWPSSLFRYLSGSASLIEWGGNIVNAKSNGGQHTSTEMGSGHFAEEGSGKAGYFKNIQIVDQSNNLRAPPQGTDSFNTNSTCYDLRYAENYVYYGGPGRNPSCP